MEVIKIQKYDNIYIKVYCDSGIAMELSEYFTFEVPGAKFSPAVRNKMWDGKIRLFNRMTCLVYAGLRLHVEQFAREREYEIEYLSDFSDTEFSLKEAGEYVDKFPQEMERRDYQIAAFAHAVRNKRALMLSPTASGKSFIIYLITRYFQERTLIVVPTTSLVHQMYSDFQAYGFDSEKYIHKIFSGQDKDTKKPIVITTWQSIYQLRKPWFEQFSVVIGDEAHLFKAKSLTTIMDKLVNCDKRFGFTGTLDGTQTHKLVLEGMFGPVKKVTTTAELIEQKHLADFKIKALILKHSEEVRQQHKNDTYQDEIDFLVRSEERNKFIKNLTLSLKGNTLLLFQFVDKHGQMLYDEIVKSAGNRHVFFVHGKVDGEDREEIRHIVEKETDAIIVASFGTFSTGVNIRNLHNIIFASPSKSVVRILQSIGRGLRKSDTKDEATLYDLADDMSWKAKKNYTLTHFAERMKIYNEEKFQYKIYTIQLGGK